MKGTVIAHSVVIATVVAFGTVVGLDIYNGVPTLGGNQMYLTKAVMFLVVMNLALWIGSLFDSMAVKRYERLYGSVSKRVDRLLQINSEKGELLNRVAEKATKVKDMSIIVGLIIAAWWVPFMTLLEVQRQGRETRRMIVDMQNLSWQFRRGNLYGGEVRPDEDFIVTNVVVGESL